MKDKKLSFKSEKTEHKRQGKTIALHNFDYEAFGSQMLYLCGFINVCIAEYTDINTN